jgi:hypothetical protein
MRWKLKIVRRKKGRKEENQSNNYDVLEKNNTNLRKP